MGDRKEDHFNGGAEGMLNPSNSVKVYLRPGRTDMRKAINGLSALAEHELKANPLGGSLFVFCNGSRNIVKLLYWDRNGYCLWQKRLSKHKFVWPRSEVAVCEIDGRQLYWLLEGMDIEEISGHEELRYDLVS